MISAKLNCKHRDPATGNCLLYFKTQCIERVELGHIEMCTGRAFICEGYCAEGAGNEK